MNTTSTQARPAQQYLTVTGHAVLDRLPLASVVAVIIAGMGIMTGSLWPSLQGTFSDLPESIADTLGTVLAGSDLTTAAGWMNAELLSATGPIGVIAVAVISMVRAIAGEEQDKTLGVLLSAPVSRTTFLLAKATAMAVHVLIVVAGLAVGMIVGSWVGDLGLSASGIIGASVHLGLLGLLFGGVAAVASAATGSSRLSSAIVAGLAGLAFAINAFVPLVDSLADLARISPWYYFANSNPLVNGTNAAHATVLTASAIMLAGLAIVVHRRRDLRG